MIAQLYNLIRLIIQDMDLETNQNLQTPCTPSFNEQKLQSLLNLLVDQQQEISLLHQTIRGELAKRDQDISALKQQTISNRQQIEQLKTQATSKNQQIANLQTVLSQFKRQNEEFQCFQHPCNPHSYHFNTHLSNHSLRIIKVSDSSFHNFISNLPIPKGAVTNFRIRQIRITDGYLYQGIGTKAVFGDVNSWNQDYVSYYSGDGDVCLNGLFRAGGSPISNGDMVTISVDLIENKVTWLIDEKKATQVIIPQHMRKGRLFLVLLMKCKGDELELLLD